jgi:formiminotetrahydrofolate cyclodeaminase
MSEEKDYLSLPLREFLADLGSRTPTPGGGSVAALAGSLGCGLARMALQFTVGKAAFAAHEQQLRALLGDLEQAGEQFTRLMAEDMRAYEAVRAARKADEASRAVAGARATAVPMHIVQLAESVVACLDELKAFVNPHLLGDLRAGAVLVNAAGRSAACTVRDNLPTMPDQQEAVRIARQLDALLARNENHCNAVVGFATAE